MTIDQEKPLKALMLKLPPLDCRDTPVILPREAMRAIMARLTRPAAALDFDKKVEMVTAPTSYTKIKPSPLSKPAKKKGPAKLKLKPEASL